LEGEWFASTLVAVTVNTFATGDATGLGLSLSCDRIKAHQGELKAESAEGEYAVFTLELSY
jgi:signal transduction histidine kinase